MPSWKVLDVYLVAACSRPYSHWRHNGVCSRWKMAALLERTISDSRREVSRLFTYACEVDLAQRKYSGSLLASSGCQSATEFSNGSRAEDGHR